MSLPIDRPKIKTFPFFRVYNFGYPKGPIHFTVKAFNKTIMSYYSFKRFAWIRIFRMGLLVKDIDRNGLIFSERVWITRRFMYRKGILRVGNILIRGLS